MEEISMFGFGGSQKLGKDGARLGGVPTTAVPDNSDYMPTAAEDAEYDRNKAAGDPGIMGEVDGKWVKLKGEDLDEAIRDFRRGDWTFLAIGMVSLIAAVVLVMSGAWFVAIFLFPFGAAFCFASIAGFKEQSRWRKRLAQRPKSEERR
jgi:hypothetical protein